MIDQLNSQIAQTQALVTSNQAILDQISANLAAMQHKLAETQAQLDREKQHLSEELVVMYELQQQSTPLKNLLTSQNFNDFWRGVIDTRRISSQESATAAKVQAIKAEIQADVVQISAERAQQQTVVNQLVATKNTLAQQQSAKQQALVQLQAQQAADQQRVAAITASNANLNNEIAQLNANEQAAQAAAAAAAAQQAQHAQQLQSGGGQSGGGGGGGGGQFAWPDSGPISQGFGCTQFQFEAYDAGCPYPHRFHNGIDIAGACGNDISASAAGIVHIEPYDPYGFGNYIIIQHGNGWSTLYGHMSGFAVGNGAAVGQGQLIGWEGTTGNSTGCHLHFGINRNNQWVDPLNYLP